MIGLNELLSLLVGLMGVLSSGVIAYLAYSLNKQGQRAQTAKDISEAYNVLMDFRTKYPHVLKLARQWQETCFQAIYGQSAQQDEQWVLYYTYVEFCISYCNPVLVGRKSGLLDKNAFEGHYGRLVKLILTEHEPFIFTALKYNKYISLYIKEFRQELEKEGWNWKAMHIALAE